MTPLLSYWSYCSLALCHRYILHCPCHRHSWSVYSANYAHVFCFRVSIDCFSPIGTSVPWRIWIHRLREFTASCIPIIKQRKVITSLWILFPTIPIRDVKVIHKIVSNVWWNHLKCLYHSQHQYIICSSWLHLSFMSVFSARFDRYWPKYVDIVTFWCSLVAVAHIDNEWM